MPPTPRRHEPKAGADLGARPAQAVRLRTAGEQNQRFEAGALKRHRAAQTQDLAQRQNATPAQPAMSATHCTRLRTTMTRSPPTIAKHPFENLTTSPAASGRTARLSSGEGRELPLRLFTQTCEPPNVGHERRLEACEARWKTSARWKG